MSTVWACCPGGPGPPLLLLLFYRRPRLFGAPGPPASPARCVQRWGRTDILLLSHRYGDVRPAMHLETDAPWQRQATAASPAASPPFTLVYCCSFTPLSARSLYQPRCHSPLTLSLSPSHHPYLDLPLPL